MITQRTSGRVARAIRRVDPLGVALALVGALLGVYIGLPSLTLAKGSRNPVRDCTAYAAGVVEVHGVGSAPPEVCVCLKERDAGGWTTVAELPLKRELPPRSTDASPASVHRYHYLLAFELRHSTAHRGHGALYPIAALMGTSRDRWEPDDYRLEVTSPVEIDVTPPSVCAVDMESFPFVAEVGGGQGAWFSEWEEEDWRASGCMHDFVVYVR